MGDALPNMSLVLPQNRIHFLLALTLIGGIAVLFWTGSRYPALDEKAMMSGAIQLEDSLSFEALVPLTPEMSLPQRMFWSTVNWIDTNKKGMTFGILFAAAFLTLTPYLRRRSFVGSLPNAALGMVIGTPLGVCVNCAAPIARGMYSAGLRAETTLAAMIASPTLNVVVLTMAFSILPFYIAAAKIALSVVMILVVVPLICRVLPQVELAEDQITCPLPAPVPGAGVGVPGALWAVLKSFAANLWYIVKMTVPLMLLAGALGAIVATLLPAELLTGLPFSLLVLVAVCVIGVFLPVPIAFDVVVTGALLAAGLAHGYVLALLFTLGTFSVYSFFIIWQSVGRRAAWLMGVAVVVLGLVGGLGAQRYYTWQSDRALKMLLGADRPAPLWSAQASTLDAVTVTETRLAPPSPASATVFERLEASAVGIDKPVEFTMRDMWPPFWEGRSLSSGDYDRDGDIDLAIASTEVGLYLYANDGGGQFTRVAVDIGPLADMPVFHAVLVDVDNDGWLDLMFATYLQGMYLLPNVQGRFDASALRPIANRADAPLAMALSFADVDGDADLDMAVGNWAAGWYRRIPGEESRNRLILNDNGQLSGKVFADMPGIPGETLSILFSDFDRDGHTDLIVGNDFDIPDYFYRGDGAGGLTMLTAQDGLIPHTTTTTMAVKTADLMNDGSPEIYLAQIAGRSSGVSDTLKMQPLRQYCDGIQDAQARTTCAENMGIKSWYRSGNSFDATYASRCQTLSGRQAEECRAMLVKDLAIQRRDPDVCALIPVNQPIPRAYCDLHFKPARQPTAAEIEVTHRQILRSNVLLEGPGPYDDTADRRGLDVGGWSWDTKIADFDNDGLQDVYIVNGTWVPNEVSPSNLFFHHQGSGFVEASGPFGLEDYLMTAAATRFDMDGDGDLDLITHPVNGPITLFRNGTQTQGVVFSLTDMVGNRDGVGAVLTLTDDAGVARSREVQLGGGFMSYDAPQVHFGLGDSIGQTLRIAWAGGESTELAGPFRPGMHYRIVRNRP
ncbi:FG-GAP-like repeat-containing protein [uncultured Tateyamaria sp.]|uniref:FG-GAP-like repeat-containing protein n=1 Tax=Tateyamaria sp. 1078 TaxID=3417464 RepID=UPI00260D8743|nr:FG-GAP-like repeat-containing protein [uncultured Tateyamaria sp.]